MSESIEAQVRAWMADDVDPEAQAELGALLDQLAADPGGAARRELEARFSGPLTFGTAGLRGRVEAGESRMNRATVIRATAGLAEQILADVPEAAARGVVLARDARRGSATFQADAAEVLLARGIRVWWLPDPTPTPVTPFAVRRLRAAAGVVITASHNPAPDNGYKVYWDHGAQIAPPLDSSIARSIDAQPGARAVPRRSRAEAEDLLEPRPDLVDAYLGVVDGLRLVPEAPVGTLRVVYTALHGVAGALFLEAMRRRGFARVSPVPEQHTPDPDFPTVDFPNPEEAGALDLAIARARAEDADLVLAHDPDGDRLAAVVRCPRRGWVTLSGNDIGILLARHLIDHDQPEDRSRLVVNTVVSSRLLGRMARDLGVRYAETLTGFKHIAERMRWLEEAEGLRGLFGYEEALGYAVCREVPDKDGISAGVVLAEMAAVAKGEGRTLLDVLEAIHRAHGLYVGRSRSVVLAGHQGPARIRTAMERLRRAEPSDLVEAGVSEVWDLASGVRRELGPGGRTYTDPSLRGDVLVFELEGGGRACARPSGTEPKLKLYLETEAAWPVDMDHDVAADVARDRLGAVEEALLGLAGLDEDGASSEPRERGAIDQGSGPS